MAGVADMGSIGMVDQRIRKHNFLNQKMSVLYWLI